MAFIECRDSFKTIRNSARFSLLLPEAGAAAASAVLYLLPVRRGLSTDWVRYTSIELWAREKNLAVVMPEGLCSDFCNMRYGMRWWDYLTQELPEYLHQLFGLPQDNCLCFGVEMGALGSLKLGLMGSERFTMAGAVAEDFLRVSRYGVGESIDHDMESIYGEAPVHEGILAQCDPVLIATSCKKSDTTLFLCHEDLGAEEIAGAGKRHVVWASRAVKSWEGYGDALKEFLDNARA